MLGPLLFVYKGYLGIFFVLQIKIYNGKKNSKKVFFTKKQLFTERKFERCCGAKKMHRGHIRWRRIFFFNFVF